MDFFFSLRRLLGLACVVVLAVVAVPARSAVTSASLASAMRPLSQYGVDFWDEASGLPQSRIRAMVQTPDGYLWLATDNGLVRFDGAAFTSFGVQTGSLLDNEVGALTQDGEGGLWIGTYGGGLTHMTRGRFVTYTTDDGLPDNIIRLLDRDLEGNIWFTTRNGVGRFSGGKFATFTTRDGLPGNSPTALCARSRQGVFVVVGNAVCRFENGRFSKLNALTFSRNDGTINHLAAGTDGALLIPLNHSIQRYKDGVVLAQDLQSSEPMTGRVLFQDPGGTIWLGTREGLFRVNGSRLEAPPSRDIQERLGVIYCMLTDREGSLWVGLEANGLARLRPIQIGWIGVEEGLPEARSRAILQDRDGTTWIGTGRGLACLREGKITTATFTNVLRPVAVAALGQDGDGALWVGSVRKLYRMRGGQFELHPAWADRGDIRIIYHDPRGPMLVGTEGDGLFRIDGDRIETLMGDDGPAGGRIRDIVRDRGGALWVATFGGGVKRFTDTTTATFTRKDGLGSDFVLAIHEDAQGTLWMSTRSGLSRWKDGRFLNFTAGHGLYCTFIHDILEDAAGDFWFSSVQGIFKVSKSELNDLGEGRIKQVNSIHYGTSEGMETLSCIAGTYPASCRTADGRLLFCTLKGVAVVNPADRIANPQPPPVHIEQALINGRPIPPDREMDIPPGRGEVEVRYNAASFLSPDKVRFKYRLEGHDPDWVEAGTRRFAYYASLPPGQYRFQVIACNNDGIWNGTGAAFAFNLRPHFHQTLWFPLLCLAGAALLGLGVRELRVRRLLAAERALHQRVEDALAKVKVLSGMLPICAHCKKVRDDKGYWNSIEHYITEHSDTEISHGLCPECIRKLYPDMANEILSRMGGE